MSTFNPARYEHPYGIDLLDDIHNLFPEVLYDNLLFHPNVLVSFFQRRVEQLFAREFARNRTQYRMFQQARRRRESGIFQPASLVYSLPSPAHSSTTTAATAPLNRTVYPTQPVTTEESEDVNEQLNQFAEQILSSVLAGFGGTSPLRSSIPILMSATTRTIPVDMTPVPVVPTAEQIQAATILTSLPPPADVVCTICQDSEVVGQSEWRIIRHCNHRFHKSCVDRWFQQNVHCPVCRFDIRDHNHDHEETED